MLTRTGITYKGWTLEIESYGSDEVYFDAISEHGGGVRFDYRGHVDAAAFEAMVEMNFPRREWAPNCSTPHNRETLMAAYAIHRAGAA